jgi:pimeloyl-ACP methyl ester carboxylesterase
MARDLDLLRSAVGDEQLTYVGMSQGTDIGATYASMFPGKARAMVLDSPVDAAGWRDRPLEIWQEQDNSYEQLLDRFFAACAREPDACGFGGGDPEDAFDALLAELDAAPIESSDPQNPGPVDGDDLRTAAAAQMVNPARWAGLAEALVQAEGGDGALVQQLAGESFDNELALDSFLGNNAASARYPRRTSDMFADLDHRYGLLDHFWARAVFVGFTAQRWPVRPRDAFTGDFEQPADAPTVLVIGTTHDPATPYQWAQRLTDDLGNARLLTYRGDGHGVITGLDACVAVALVAYLEDGTLPPKGAACEQDLDPFAARASATASPRGLRWRADFRDRGSRE